jgi:hypothetical protein
MDFSVWFVADDERSGEVECSIPDNEWADFVAFRSEVERLRATKFVQNKRGGHISVSWKLGKPLSVSAPTQYDEEEVLAMLLRLRPFVLEDEEFYFNKIKNRLKRRLQHRIFHKHLDLLADGFTLKLMTRKIGLQGQGRPPLSVGVVMDWLNSFEYHRDKKKRQTVEHDLGIFEKDRNGLPIVLIALVDMVQSVLHLSDFVETLEQIVEGSRTEIKIPLDWLSSTQHN